MNNDDRYIKKLFTEVHSRRLYNGQNQVEGVLTHSMAAMVPLKRLFVQWWAAAPMTRNSSYMGSGIPYPNEEVAFSQNHSSGVEPVVNGYYKFRLNYPNSYFVNLGTEFIPPSVHLQVVDEFNTELTPVHTISLAAPITLRDADIDRDWSSGPLYYTPKRGSILSQWDRITKIGLPEKLESDFTTPKRQF